MSEITERGELRLTQQDLDRGLTDEQLDWLESHLNMKALAYIFQGYAIPKEVDSAPENATGAMESSTGGDMDEG